MSPPTDDLVVGRIAGLFGIRGELKCDPTSAGRICFVTGKSLRCSRGETVTEIRLASVRPHKGRLLITIDGADDAETARAYVGATLLAPRDELAIADGEFLDADLVGCSVIGVDGTAYGTVERVEHFPASDMLVVGGHFVPMVAAIVTEIDLEGRRVLVDPPAGLFD